MDHLCLVINMLVQQELRTDFTAAEQHPHSVEAMQLQLFNPVPGLQLKEHA